MSCDDMVAYDVGGESVQKRNGYNVNSVSTGRSVLSKTHKSERSLIHQNPIAKSLEA